MAAANMNSMNEWESRKFEQKWMLPNWNTGVPAPNEKFGRAKAEFHLNAENVVYAKFLVEASFDHLNSFKFSWTLLSKHHCLDKEVAEMVSEIEKSDGTVVRYEITADPLIEKTYHSHKTIDDCLSTNSALTCWTNSELTLEIKLRCTLRLFSNFEFLIFSSKCMDELSRNMAALLRDKQNCDVTIHTKDNTELFAHKNILQARCPIFASMFGSVFLESSTGLVNVDDISAKTMKILLNYWYTGTLLPYWTDDDTIVEFTYAAGKYQLMPVLKMLNDFLGRNPKVSCVDVELLKITNQLSLKNVEARILKGIIRRISSAKCGTEILDYFCISAEKFDGESFPASHNFEKGSDATSENNEAVATPQDIKLMALAINFGMKNVENKILKRIIYTVSKVGSTEELFALFDLPNEEHTLVSVSKNSDVRD